MGGDAANSGAACAGIPREKAGRPQEFVLLESARIGGSITNTQQGTAMRLAMLPLLLFIGLASTGTAAQSVYKCVDARGTTVFSQRPCADDPAKVETVDTSRALKTGSGGAVAEQSEFAQMNQLRRRCDDRLRAVQDRYGRDYGRIEREISSLEARSDRASNNLAGATWESGMRSQIAGLMTERGALRTAEAQELSSVREQCRIDEQEEEKRQQDAQEARAAAKQESEKAAADKAAADKAKAEKDAKG